MEKIKDLYCGRFDYQGRIYVERCRAYSEKQAWMIFCRRIANKPEVKREPSSIMGLYSGNNDKWKIIKEIEFTEEKENIG